jgi:streptogrisin C
LLNSRRGLICGGSRFKLIAALTLASILGALVAVNSALAETAETMPLASAIPGSSSAAEASGYAQQFGVTQAEAESRLTLQRKAMATIAELKTNLGTNYAGAWFDNTTGRLEVGSVAAQDAATIATTANANAIGPNTDVVSVQSTLAELESAQISINEAISGPEHAQEVATGLDLGANAVLIRESAAALAGTRSLIKQAVSSSPTVKVEVRQVSPATLQIRPAVASCGWNPQEPGWLYCARPLRGGVSINSSHASCTDGFQAYYPSAGSVQFVLTAGHCIEGTTLGESGTTWSSETSSRNGSYAIGPSWGYRVDSTGDYGDIKIKGNSYWYKDEPGYFVVDTRPGGLGYENALHHIVSDDSPGLYNCHTGESSLTSCGEVLSVDNSFCYSGGEGCPGDMTEDSFGGIPGDSGGPVWGNDWAFGVFDAIDSESGPSFYSELESILPGTGGMNISLGP